MLLIVKSKSMKIRLSIILVLCLGVNTFGQNDNSLKENEKSMTIKNFFDTLELNVKMYVIDTTINLYGPELNLKGFKGENYEIFAGCNDEPCSYFEGYLISLEKGMIWVMSDSYMKNTKRILLLDLDKNIQGVLSFVEGKLIGASKINYNVNDEIIEDFVFIHHNFWNLGKSSIDDVFDENFLSDLIALHENSAYNVKYHRVLSEINIKTLYGIGL
jgi:hypothetical protein